MCLAAAVTFFHKEVPVAITRSSRPDNRWRRGFAALAAGLFAGVLLMGPVSPAAAQTEEEEDLPYSVAVNVKTAGEGIEGATVVVTRFGEAALC